jgi:hypothetical protein
MQSNRVLYTLIAVLSAFIFLALVLPGPGNLASAQAEDGETVLYLPLIFKSSYSPGYGLLHGKIVDATDGAAIEDVLICVGQKCDETGAVGDYSIPFIPTGLYTLTAEVSSWIPIEETINIPQGVTEMVIAMAVPFDEPETRHYVQIVLTWGAPWYPPDPASDGDMDAHLWITSTLWTTDTFHINAADSSTYAYCDEPPYACYAYHKDVQTGYGPETIDVAEVLGGAGITTSYGVLNYDAGYPGVPDITETEAVVRVFEGETHIATFSVPPAGNGDFWYVFDLERSGEDTVIVLKNCITGYPGDGMPACSGGLKGFVKTFSPLRPPKP